MPLYPDPPAHPMIPYHIDGSGVFRDVLTTAVALTGTEKTDVTKQYGDVNIFTCGQNVTRYIGIQFPTPVNVRTWHAQYAGNLSGTTPGTMFAPEWSTTTTNFIDGTWTAFSGSTTYQPAIQGWLTGTNNAVSVDNITHIRMGVRGGSNSSASVSLRNFLLYGWYATPIGLELWHPTLDQRLTAPNLYYGDTPRSTTSDLTFRVKNQSATQTANSITVGMFAGYDVTPANLSLFTLSNGGAFASSINIGNLAPGAISSVITLRRTHTSTAAFGAYAVRVRATAGSWV